MDFVNWPQVVAALIGGGAVGAIITATVSSFRSRVQPVGNRVEILPVFHPTGSASSLAAAIAIDRGDGEVVTYRNLFLAEVVVLNKGNTDLTEFKFGITLAGEDECIHAETFSPDRHHTVALLSPPLPGFPRKELDFALVPFNRRDSYSFKLYIVIPVDAMEPKPLELGSPSPVRFVPIQTPQEVLWLAIADVATKTTVAGISVDTIIKRRR